MISTFGSTYIVEEFSSNMNTIKTQTEIDWMMGNKAVFMLQLLDYLHVTTLSIFSKYFLL